MWTLTMLIPTKVASFNPSASILLFCKTRILSICLYASRIFVSRGYLSPAWYLMRLSFYLPSSNWSRPYFFHYFPTRYRLCTETWTISNVTTPPAHSPINSSGKNGCFSCSPREPYITPAYQPLFSEQFFSFIFWSFMHNWVIIEMPLFSL